MADLDEEIRRGMDAERLMNEPMLKDALQTMKTALQGELNRADLNNSDRLKTLVGHIQAVNSFEKLLRSTMETGKMARIQKNTRDASNLRKVKG